MKNAFERKLTHTAGAFLVALALSLLVSPAFAQAASLSAGERSELEIQELVEGMLSRGRYVEGEAIVCFLPASDEGLTASEARSEARP